MRRAISIAFIACLMVAWEPKQDAVILPAFLTPQPPAKDAPVQLAMGQVYLVQAREPVVVVTASDGVLSVMQMTKVTDPITPGPCILYPATAPTWKPLAADIKYAYGVMGIAKGVDSLIIVVLSTGQVMRVQIQVMDGPSPGPGPTPTPLDPLAQALQDAYTKESDPKKVAKTADLITYYSTIVGKLKSAGAVTTELKVHDAIHAGADSIAGQGGMPALRKVASNYIAAKMPNKDQPMTDALWTAATQAYGDVAIALGKVK